MNKIKIWVWTVIVGVAASVDHHSSLSQKTLIIMTRFKGLHLTAIEVVRTNILAYLEYKISIWSNILLSIWFSGTDYHLSSISKYQIINYVLKIGTGSIQNYLYLEIFLRLGQKLENDCRYNARKPSNKDGGQRLNNHTNDG